MKHLIRIYMDMLSAMIAVLVWVFAFPATAKAFSDMGLKARAVICLLPVMTMLSSNVVDFIADWSLRNLENR